MYSGTAKGSGHVVGLIGRSATCGSIEFPDALECCDATSADETLIALNEDGEQIVLSPILSCETGDLIWDCIYDPMPYYVKTVCMSQMTSMLRDNDRNSIYDVAIQTCLANFIQKYNRNPTVIDIGAGTGLLSMLCMRHGADKVVGCEMFQMMASIATNVVSSNNFSAIDVVNAKSVDISYDSCPFADIIVSELLDSALLGESCIPSHLDAITRLFHRTYSSNDVDPDFEDRIIPNSAAIYATLVESSDVKNMFNVSNIGHNCFTPYRTNGDNTCRGGWKGIPIHWNELMSRGNTKVISKTVKALDINFNRENDTQTFSTIIEVTAEGTLHGVMIYWDLYLLSAVLDPSRLCKYSTSPNIQNWQDHWLQMIYYIPADLKCQIGDFIKLYISHDAMTIWVHAEKVALIDSDKQHKKLKLEQNLKEEELCSCGWHMLCGAERLERLNDEYLFEQWKKSLKLAANSFMNDPNICTSKFIALDVSDGSSLAFMLAHYIKNLTIPSSKSSFNIVSKELKQFSSIFYSQLLDENVSCCHIDDDMVMIWDGLNINDILDYFDEDDDDDDHGGGDNEKCDKYHQEVKISCLMSECFYYQLHSMPLLQAVSFYYQRNSYQHELLPSALIMPFKAIVMVAPIQLTDLGSGHGSVAQVLGFDHSAYDSVVEGNWYQYLYPYKLGNYRKILLAKPQRVCEIDYVNKMKDINETCLFPTTISGRCDAVMIWVDYGLYHDEQNEIMLNFYRIQNSGVEDFPLYYYPNIIFLKDSIDVTMKSHICSIKCEFQIGMPNIKLSVEILSNTQE